MLRGLIRSSNLSKIFRFICRASQKCRYSHLSAHWFTLIILLLCLMLRILFSDFHIRGHCNFLKASSLAPGTSASASDSISGTILTNCSALCQECLSLVDAGYATLGWSPPPSKVEPLFDPRQRKLTWAKCAACHQSNWRLQEQTHQHVFCCEERRRTGTV